MASEFNADMLRIAMQVPEHAERDIHTFCCRLIGVVECCMGQEVANELALRLNMPYLVKEVPAAEEEWYDADGTPNPRGAYDAGGHHYGERAANYQRED